MSPSIASAASPVAARAAEWNKEGSAWMDVLFTVLEGRLRLDGVCVCVERVNEG